MGDTSKGTNAPIQHTGWTSLEKTIHDLDEAKMKDCKDDIDTLLIFTRGYTTTTGFINATATVAVSDPSLPFEASHDDIRVNVLWFSSLIFDLSAASFGMLVKQWLREYMAGDHTSPRLALGLFFVGLCFFTWSVNRHVAYTSIPLVGVWALLFLSATVAPALSPRCPYKTAFTRRGMKTLRRLLFRSAPGRGLSSLSSMLHWKTVKPLSSRPSNEKDLEESTSGNCDVTSVMFEEEDAIQDDGDDISLLTTLDEMLLDDDLLFTSITQALRQIQADPFDTIKFIFGAVGRRIHEDFPLETTSLPNLQRKLTKSVWHNSVDITAEVIKTHLNQPGRDSHWPDWMSHALTFLFSLCEHTLTEEAEHAILMCLSSRTDPVIRNGAIRIIASHAGDKVRYGHILRQLRGVLAQMPISDDRREILLSIAPQRLGYVPERLVDLVRESSSMDDLELSALLVLLIDCTRTQFGKNEWALGTREALCALMSSSIPIGSEKSFVALVSELMCIKASMWGVVRYVVSVEEKARSVGPTARRIIGLAFTNGSVIVRGQMLEHLTKLMLTYTEGKLDNTAKFNPLNPIRACLLSMHLVDEVQGQLFSDEDDIRSKWRSLWSSLGDAVKRYGTLSKNASEDNHQLAINCLLSIQAIDAANRTSKDESDCQDYWRWLDGFKVEDSLFPDELIIALRFFIPTKEYGSTSASLSHAQYRFLICRLFL
ncbi:hypothetical protein EW026_g6128 [Hermanssonia centrifuga]|uniref:DUF6535 domain-containing protein n=1 Tax=Hermanssonia centrifuga TaxID=98765 RepID=A0A4S4KC11_9APHY|nr:hypothetical protein EW026_g6128 [Hermanssonia centrifuga]